MIEDYSIWDVRSELRPTKMAILDINRACSQKCKICYHRFTTFDAPEGKENYWTMPLEDIKKELDCAKARGCNRADFTGGEPMLHPNIIEIIEYCKKINIEPRLITNGQYSNDFMDKIINTGCKDFLFSYHNIELRHDNMTQVKGSFERMNECLRYIISRGCIYATNTVIYNDNYSQLPNIFKMILDNPKKPYIMNLININPQYEPDHELAHRDIAAKISDSSIHIERAIELAEGENIMVNVRYFPMCAISKQYRKNIVNFYQNPFDWRNEWDYGVNPKTVVDHLNRMKEGFVNVSSYREGKCFDCGIKDVCGGANAKYVECFGEDELTPQNIKSNDPNYYRKETEMTTIIIPAYNPGANLTRLLTEIQHKTAPPYNVVLVRGSRSASRNRNEGLSSVSKTSKYIIMCDDDICELPYMWNKRLIDRLQYDPNLMAVSARLMTIDGRPALNSADNFNINTEYEEVNMIPTACCAFRSDDVEYSCVGFEELMVASGWEDSLFFEQLKNRLTKEKLGNKIIIDNNCKVVHLNNATGQGTWNDYNKQIYVDKMKKEYSEK